MAEQKNGKNPDPWGCQLNLPWTANLWTLYQILFNLSCFSVFSSDVTFTGTTDRHDNSRPWGTERRCVVLRWTTLGLQPSLTPRYPEDSVRLFVAHQLASSYRLECSSLSHAHLWLGRKHFQLTLGCKETRCTQYLTCSVATHRYATNTGLSLSLTVEVHWLDCWLFNSCSVFPVLKPLPDWPWSHCEVEIGTLSNHPFESTF